MFAYSHKLYAFYRVILWFVINDSRHVYVTNYTTSTTKLYTTTVYAFYRIILRIILWLVITYSRHYKLYAFYRMILWFVITDSRS